MRKVLMVLLLACGDLNLIEEWEERVREEPEAVLMEIGDSLRKQSFREKVDNLISEPKLIQVVLKAGWSADFRDLPLDTLVLLADALRSVKVYMYNEGIFDKRWVNLLLIYKRLLKDSYLKLKRIEDLDSLEYYARVLEPFLDLRIYRAEFDSIVNLYRKMSMQQGSIRWGMSESDVLTLKGEPDRVDTVYSMGSFSFGKVFYFGDTAVLLLNGRVEDVWTTELDLPGL